MFVTCPDDALYFCVQMLHTEYTMSTDVSSINVVCKDIVIDARDAYKLAVTSCLHGCEHLKRS